MLLLFEGCFVFELFDVVVMLLLCLVCSFWLYVMMMYDENGGYLYLDYIMIYKVVMEVFEVVGDPDWYLGIGAFW